MKRFSWHGEMLQRGRPISRLNLSDSEAIKLDLEVYRNLLHDCINRKSIEDGKTVHTHIMKHVVSLDVIVESTLVNMYIKCGSFEDACRVFECMDSRDSVSWNMMIGGYSNHKRPNDAINMFWAMVKDGFKPTKITYVHVLKSCTDSGLLEQGKKFHELIKKEGISDVFLGAALMGMYAKCGCIDDARLVFEEMKEHDVVSWNVIIGVYAESGNSSEALNLFNRMQENVPPNGITFANTLKACVNSVDVDRGREIYSLMVKCGIEMDIIFGSCLLDMYAKCGNIVDACHVFDCLEKKDVVTYNVMIAGYAQFGLGNEAFKLLHRMHDDRMKPDRVTFLSLLKACVGLSSLTLGKRVHVHIILNGYGTDIKIGNTVIDMYAKCGSMVHAQQLFDQLPTKDAITWTAMVAGYVQHRQFNEAFNLFWAMQNELIEPTEATYVSILKGCGEIGSLEQGHQIHALILRSGFQTTIPIESTLIDMYCKCGSVRRAREVFDQMRKHDVISWTAMIIGYAQHGHGKEALIITKEMLAKGVIPDHITFMGILSACNHMGLVEDALSYFHSMSEDYGIMPGAEHYGCLIDLLGRAGHLDKVDNLMKKMPRQPNAMVWTSSLGACGIHGNMKLATHASQCLHSVEPGNTAAFVLLSNMYAKSSDIENVPNDGRRTRIRSTEIGSMENEAMYNYIEVNNKVNVFSFEDSEHPDMHEANEELERL